MYYNTMTRPNPAQVVAMSRKEIAGFVEPPALAKRLWAKRVLWFCWMEPEATAPPATELFACAPLFLLK